MTEQFVVRVEARGVESELLAVEASSVKEAMVKAVIQTFQERKLRSVVAVAVWQRVELLAPESGEKT